MNDISMILFRTMKTIRYIAALLMLISGIWHVVLYFKVPEYHLLLILLFGIVYLVTSLLLSMTKKIGAYFGLIFPLMALVGTVVQTSDLKSLDLTARILLLIAVVVVVCCACLILARKKTT
jgi:hypothetical protein